MQEWIIAMLVISVLLVLRDMAKTFFRGRSFRKAEQPEQEKNPQKEKVERYAASFRKLADSFYGLPYRKDYLSNGQVDGIIRETCDEICSHCYQREICWGTQSQEMYRGSERMIRSMEEGNQEKIQETKSDWMSVCSRFSQYYETLGNSYMRERQKLIWDNRMIESRLAVAQQLQEMSRIMDMVAEDLYDISIADPQLMTELQKILRKRHIVVKQVWVMDKVEGRREIFLTMRARSGQCISVNEVAQLLSQEFGTPMAAAGGGRRIVNGEYHTVHFVEDVSYQVLYGVAKLTKEMEKVSGDNYICRQEEAGRFVMCLSDGMGSGVEACRESEEVVELLE